MDYSRQRYEEVDIDRLVEFPGNPNIGDEEAVDESMQQNGWYGVVVTREMPGTDELQILGGHTRRRVARERGATTVPAVILSGVDDLAALRILLGDNETARRGRYDNKKLADRIRELPDLKGSGFPSDYLAQLEEFEANRVAAAAEEKEKEAAEKASGPAPGGDFEEEFGILIECESEEEQRELYERLTRDVSLDASRLRVLSI